MRTISRVPLFPRRSHGRVPLSERNVLRRGRVGIGGLTLAFVALLLACGPAEAASEPTDRAGGYPVGGQAFAGVAAARGVFAGSPALDSSGSAETGSLDAGPGTRALGPEWARSSFLGSLGGIRVGVWNLLGVLSALAGLTALLTLGFLVLRPSPVRKTVAAEPDSKRVPLTLDRRWKPRRSGSNCPACGASLTAAPRFCSACGEVVE